MNMVAPEDVYPTLPNASIVSAPFFHQRESVICLIIRSRFPDISPFISHSQRQSPSLMFAKPPILFNITLDSLWKHSNQLKVNIQIKNDNGISSYALSMFVANLWTDSAATEQLRTITTDLLGVKHPIMLAGMHIASGPKLAAAVANAGGFGTIGGLGYTPDELRQQIEELKENLHDKDTPFGVDLLLPQIGGSARPTKYVGFLEERNNLLTLT